MTKFSIFFSIRFFLRLSAIVFLHNVFLSKISVKQALLYFIFIFLDFFAQKSGFFMSFIV